MNTILDNNYFSFNGKFYQQIKGTAMGTKFAPTYATLVLGYLEEILYTKIEYKYDKQYADFLEQLWKRFLDDCFIFWTKSRTDLLDFQQILNDLHPDLNFTIEVAEDKLSFLDILVLKKKNKISK